MGRKVLGKITVTSCTNACSCGLSFTTPSARTSPTYISENKTIHCQMTGTDNSLYYNPARQDTKRNFLLKALKKTMFLTNLDFSSMTHVMVSATV
jgi:hypothetical protein